MIFLVQWSDSEKFELAVINPAFVVGPILTQQGGTSIDFITRILSGKDFFLPKVSFPVVDVRDVAKAHVLAMTVPEAAGMFFECRLRSLNVSGGMWVF